jgi:hypothetical protein
MRFVIAALASREEKLMNEDGGNRQISLYLRLHNFAPITQPKSAAGQIQ